MYSLQGRGLRLVLNVRKRLVDWEAPVERFRGMMARSDRLFKPPPDVQVKPVVTDGVPGEWLIPPDASPRSILLYLHGGGWTLGWSNVPLEAIGGFIRERLAPVSNQGASA